MLHSRAQTLLQRPSTRPSQCVVARSCHSQSHSVTAARLPSLAPASLPASTSTSTCSSPSPATPGRRAALALFSAGLASAASAFSSPAAMAVPADEDPNTVAGRAIAEYTALEGKFAKDQKALDAFRAKYNFRRASDGRVSVKASNGKWYSVRLDMEVPGALLLRDSDGLIYAVQTDGLQQVDLSDDFVVLLMFAEGDWQVQLAPVEISDERGKVVQLKLEEKQFRDVIGLLKELQDAEDASGGK